MFSRYLFLLCLTTSSLFAASFNLDVTCLVDYERHDLYFDIDESKPCQIISGDLNFMFAILSSNKQQIAVQTTVMRKAAENSVSTLIAQPIIVTPFDSAASIACDELEGPNFKLALVASKK